MKWVKQNLVTIIFIFAFVLFSAAVGWLAQYSIGKLKSMEANLDAGHTTLEQLRGSKPYPSKENVDLLQKELQNFTKQYEMLRAAMSRGKVSLPGKLDPIMFQQALYQKWGRLQQSAVRANVKLPEKFAFGFGRYLNTTPCADAKGDECDRRLQLLMKELLVMENVTDLLISNHVESIRGIRRAEVEPGNLSADVLGMAKAPEPSSLYEILPFEFQFVCNTTSLREVVNALSRFEYLFVVRSLTVSTETIQEQVSPGPAVNPFFAAPSARSLATTSSQATIMHRSLVVIIRLDLVEFPQPRKDKESQQPNTHS